MLKQTLEDLKSREISYKALLPTAVSNRTRPEKYYIYNDVLNTTSFQRVIERYHTALQQKTNELVSIQIKMKDLKTEKDELTKAYMCCKARADLIEDEKNEALRK